MFSGLSKLADKAFVLGFFLPALLGILGFMIANYDLPLVCRAVRSALVSGKDVTDLFAVIAIVWIFAVFLTATNHWTYQLLEGYIGIFRMPFARNAQIRRRAVRRAKTRLLNTVYRTAKSERERAEVSGKLSNDHFLRVEETRLHFQYLRASELNAREYPKETANVLATRFGNVLRAFEMYSSDVYGADSIYVWPRLIAVIPSSYQNAIADARASVDFLVSLIAMASLVIVTALARALALWLSNVPSYNGRVLHLVGAAIVALVVARICYEIAVSSASRWGDMVKGAFDLYLPTLATTLGYELPASLDAQKHFWQEWSFQFRFHQGVDNTGWVRTSKRMEQKVTAPEPEQFEDDT